MRILLFSEITLFKNNVSTILSPIADAGNGEFIILCNFGGRIMSGFESIEENRSQEVKKSNMERWSVDLNNKKNILIL